MSGGSISIDWHDSECNTDPPLDGSRYLLDIQRPFRPSRNNNGGVIQVTKVPEVGQYLLVPDLRSTDDPNKSAIVSIDGIETEIFGSATKATWEAHAIPFTASMTNVQIHIDNPDDHPGFSGPTGGPLVRLPASPFAAAENGDTVLVGPGTYTGAGSVVFNASGRDLAIGGIAGSELTIYDGENQRACAWVYGNGDKVVTFVGLTFRNGLGKTNIGGGLSSGGVSIYESGQAIVRQCRFDSNHAESDGGAMVVGEDSSVVIDSCVFIDNTSIRSGGAIYAVTSTVELIDSRFEKNRSADGGGIFCSNSDLSAIQVTMRRNESAGFNTGNGAIYVHSDSSSNFWDSVFDGNVAVDGGAVHAFSNSSVLFSNCVLTENIASDEGGGVWSQDASVAIGDSVLCENSPRQIYGGYQDLEGNIVSDQCGEADCNGDGIVDLVQILDGTLTDDDGDGVPDVCDPCLGDITRNGVVDAADLGILLAVWNTDGKSNPEADINSDGTVNAADLGILPGAWGVCP